MAKKYAVIIDHSEYEYYEDKEHAEEVVVELKNSEEYAAEYRQGIYDIYVKEIEE